MADCLGVELDNRSLNVLEVGAGSLYEIIHIGISAQDLQAGSHLGKGRRGLSSPLSILVVPCDNGQGFLPVIGQAVADYLYKREPIEDG